MHLRRLLPSSSWSYKMPLAPVKGYWALKYLPSRFSGDLNGLWLDIAQKSSLYVNHSFICERSKCLLRKGSFAPQDTSFLLVSSNSNKKKLNPRLNWKYRTISGTCICNCLPSFLGQVLQSQSTIHFDHSISRQFKKKWICFFSFHLCFFQTHYLFKLKGASFWPFL